MDTKTVFRILFSPRKRSIFKLLTESQYKQMAAANVSCNAGKHSYVNLHSTPMLRRMTTAEAARQELESDDTKMQAWQLHSYGGLEELQFSKAIRVPVIKRPSDVIISVSASSVNPIDVAMMGGYGSVALNKLRQLESCSTKKTLEFPLTLGRDFSGHVVAKGLEVGNEFKIGDEVWGTIPPHQQGSHAQTVRVDKLFIHKKPCNLKHEEAGSLLYVALTAWSSLKISGDFLWMSPKRKKVLVLGGSGGVGSVAIQLLKAWGAEVIATCQTDAVPLVESFGADCVIDYTQADAEKLIKSEGKYDVILDAAGIGAEDGAHYAEYLKDWNLSKYITLKSPLLRNVDEYGLVGGMVKNGMDLLIPNVKTGIKSASSTIRWAFYLSTPSALKEITQLVEQSQVNPAIEKIYPFSELPAAYERVMKGHLRGKIVLNMKEENESHKEGKEQ